MRHLSVLIALLAAGPVSRAEPANPALSDQEIADGWLMLFDGESTFGWTVKGDVAVKEGELTLEKNASVTYHSQFTSFDLWVEGSGTGDVGLEAKPNATFFGFGPTSKTKAFRVTQGAAWASSFAKDTSQATSKHLVTSPGPVTISLAASNEAPLRIKSVKLRPTNTTPLFNGKDLTGWTLFTGDAGKRKLTSKFDVTPQGELHVVDGPGDLQTTGKYADFCLQFDCQTNGKQLNSGIFFRCLPDQYQNGYEAQIQNGYLGERTNPVDFGTGAIYRRVKSRKVVSNDNEWFTMTVLAQGKHIATWVNGYPTVDWTDDRPENENPRQGSKTAAGHLSIQGHDPTTDILFRNLRIADMKK